MAATTKTKTIRRTWTPAKKQSVLTEIQHALTNGSTIQSVLEKHRISHGMFRKWNEKFGIVGDDYLESVINDEVDEPQSPKSEPASLQQAIDTLRQKRDFLTEIIADLERIVVRSH